MQSAMSLQMRKQNEYKVENQSKTLTSLNCTSNKKRLKTKRLSSASVRMAGVMMCDVIISHGVNIPSMGSSYLDLPKLGWIAFQHKMLSCGWV